MTLPASGAITMAQVLAELQVANAARTTPISLNDSDVRTLAGKASGVISLSDLYGKSAAHPVSQSNVGLTKTGTSSATYTATLNLASDGSIKVNGTTIAATWYTPTTAGIGASYWAKLTSKTGSGTTSGMATPTQLTSGATLSISNPTTTTEYTGTYTVTIYSDSGGTNAVATITGDYDVGRVL